jgi:hypothetical protein
MSQKAYPTLKKRSLALKELAFGFLLLSLFGWLRVWQSLEDWPWLVRYNATPGPVYLVLSGGLWGLMGLVTGVGVWQRWRWSFWYSTGAAVVYAAWYWVDRLALARSVVGQVNWPFAAGLTAFGLFFTFLVAAAELRTRTQPAEEIR